MAWCTVAQVAPLIQQSLFSTEPATQSALRSTADAQLRQLKTDAINFGDVIAEIAVASLLQNTPSPLSDSDANQKLSYGALLMLDGMMTQSSWSEGRVVSDKPLVTGQLMHLLQQQEQFAALNGKYLDLVASTLAKICAIDYNVDGPWPEYIMRAVATSVRPINEEAVDPTELAASRRFLRHAATHGRTSPELWTLLSNSCVEQLILPALCLYNDNSNHSKSFHEDVHQSHSLTVTMTCLAELMASLASKAPVSRASQESRLLQSDVILAVHTAQASIRFVELWQLQVPVDSNSKSNSNLMVLRLLCQQRVHWLTVLLHAPKRPETHRPVMEDALQLLTTLQRNYTEIVPSGVPRNDALRAVLCEVLEVMQAILEALPSAWDWFEPAEIIQTFLWLLIDEEDYNTSMEWDEIGEHIIGMIEGDNTQLAGCGSGTTKAVATSIIQLMMESKGSNALVEMVHVWLQMAGSMMGGDDSKGMAPYWGALLSAMHAFCAQAAQNQQSLLNALEDDATLYERILGILGQVVAQYTATASSDSSSSSCSKSGNTYSGTGSWIAIRALYVLSLSIGNTTDGAACKAIFQGMLGLLQSESGHPASPLASMALSVATAATTAWMEREEEYGREAQSQLPPSLVTCALWVASTGGAVGAYCGGSAITDFLELVPMWGSLLWLPSESGASLVDAMNSILRNCRTSTQQKTLTRLIQLLVDTHFAVGDGSRCAVFQRVCDSILCAGAEDETVGAAVTRAVAEALGPLCVTLSSASSGAQCHCGGVVAALTYHVCRVAQANGPHDDGMLRCLATTLGTVGAAQPVAIASMTDAVLSIFQQAVDRDNRTMPATVSAAALTVAAFTIPQSAVFVTSASLSVYMDHVVAKCHRPKDFGCGAPALYTALCSAADPWSTMIDVLYQRLRPGGSATASGASMGKFWALWTSTLCFADRRTQLYSLIGWSRIVQVILERGGAEGSRLLTMPLQGADFCKMRSMHEDPQTHRTVHGCSLLQLMVLALCDVSATKLFVKLTNFTLQPVFDAILSPNRQRFVMEQDDRESVIVPLLEKTSSEGAEFLLSFWASHESVRPLIQEQWVQTGRTIAESRR